MKTFLTRRKGQDKVHRLMQEHVRYQLVDLAKKIGPNKAAKVGACSPTTLRKWLRRLDDQEFLIDRLLRRPERYYRCPANRTPQHIRDKVIKLRKESGFGPERIIQHLRLRISPRTVSRILREEGLARDWGEHQGRAEPNERYIQLLDRVLFEIQRRAWGRFWDSDCGLDYTQRTRIVKRLQRPVQEARNRAFGIA